MWDTGYQQEDDEEARREEDAAHQARLERMRRQFQRRADVHEAKLEAAREEQLEVQQAQQAVAVKVEDAALA